MKSLIKIANKKTSDDTRLIVICLDHSVQEKETADIDNYGLVDFKTLKAAGAEILEARANEALL